MPDSDFDLLRRMPVFGGLNNGALKLIVENSREADFAAGEYFFREGERGKSLYVLREGAVLIERRWREQTVVLGRLSVGDCVGEMSLIDMMPRSASVRAEIECRAIEVTQASLHKLYKQELEQFTMIMMNMGREVSRRLRLSDDRLFSLEQKLPEVLV